jgi:hypothetical protein
MPATPIQRLAKALCAATSGGKPEAVVAFARGWRIEGRIARRAARCIDINASDYLRLCAALGLDPVSFKKAAGGPRAITDIDWRLVSAVALMAQINGNLAIRAAAARWKLATPALVRIRDGLPVNVENYLAFCRASDIKAHPHKFLSRQPMFHGEQSVEQKPRTVGMVEAMVLDA